MKTTWKKIMICIATLAIIFSSVFSNVALPVYAATDEKTFFSKIKHMM